ncbi:MAG: alpha/beta fold hydrolase [Pseudomonadota bacterium]
MLALAWLLTSCAPYRYAIAPLGQASFGDYQRETDLWLQHQRAFQKADHADELRWNAPAEWRPVGVARKGIVLFHGLGDSPWSFADIGRALAEQGFLVRAALLPGHGTKPADLMNVDVDDWRRLVREQVALLKQSVPQVYLGGFSTGANLAVEYAVDDPQVAGLLLFSPAFKASVPFDWAMPLVSWARPWLHAPNDRETQQTPVRYLNVPTHGYTQYYYSSAGVRAKLAERPYDKPVLMVAAQHDALIDVEFVRQRFLSRFPHPASRMIWYGNAPLGGAASPRVLVRSDHLPRQRISQFSHMGILFSPHNPVYGSDGSQRYCWNGQDEAATRSCMEGAPVWYSDWGYQEAGKVHARLTFNPYFDWQCDVMRQVLTGAGDGPERL